MAKIKRTDGTGEASAEGVGKARKRPDVKVGFKIAPELDFRLTVLAKAQRMHKRLFVAKLLEQGCSSYQMDKALRANWATIPQQDEPPTQDVAA